MLLCGAHGRQGHFFFWAGMMHVVIVMEQNIWETQEWMEPKFGAHVAVWPGHLSSSGHFVMLSK